ncbi:uncharacterized protein LOC124895200 [Capsicum annuum]|uniref:uncharacterized protein LOC124895200 n=1 Tax=Capsicum annuum TaxID=4072 RepID=UPI001FB1197E|nr:uncharacterized protein LOC124895200 [Capsicum annuum]
MASPLPSRPPPANRATSGAAIDGDGQPSLHVATPSSSRLLSPLRRTSNSRDTASNPLPQRYLRQTPSAFQPCNPSSSKMKNPSSESYWEEKVCESHSAEWEKR